MIDFKKNLYIGPWINHFGINARTRNFRPRLIFGIGLKGEQAHTMQHQRFILILQQLQMARRVQVNDVTSLPGVLF